MPRDREYDNTNRGALFLNDRRSNDRAPQWRGQCTIKTPDGELVEFWISCWEQTSRNGDDFLSLSFEEKDESSERSGRGDDRRSRGRDDRDDRRRSPVGRNRDSRDDDRRTAPASSRRRDDDDRRGDPRDRDRPAVDRDLDDEVPFN